MDEKNTLLPQVQFTFTLSGGKNISVGPPYRRALPLCIHNFLVWDIQAQNDEPRYASSRQPVRLFLGARRLVLEVNGCPAVSILLDAWRPVTDGVAVDRVRNQIHVGAIDGHG